MRRRFLTTLAAAAVVVGGLNVAAYAATGGNFLLGKSNSANRPTTLTNTGNGPALTLKTKATAPPLAVSSKKVVKRLNADTVDGKQARSLQTRPSVFSLPLTPATDRFLVQVDLAPGAYQVSYAVVANTSGDQLNCYWNSTFEGSVTVAGFAYGAIFATFSTANSTTAFLSSGTEDWLECFVLGGTATISTAQQAVSQIIVTRVDNLAYKSGTSPRRFVRTERSPAQGG